MNRQLVAQTETNKSYGTGGHWFGYEIFDTDGAFSLVIHTSTYDGVRRSSHWATPEVPLKALTKDGAIEEATTTMAEYIRTVLGLAQ